MERKRASELTSTVIGGHSDEDAVAHEDSQTQATEISASNIQPYDHDDGDNESAAPAPCCVNDRASTAYSDIINTKTVPFYRLFAYADGIDCAVMVVGCLAAIAHGAALPVFFMYFGRLIDELGSMSRDSERGSREVNKFALYFVYLGIVRFLSGWIEVWLWTFTGDRQAARFRMKYVKSLLTQDVGFFDTDISTGEASVGISSDTALIQGAVGVNTGNVIHYLSQCVAGFAVSFAYVWQITLVMVAILPVITLTGALCGYAVSILSSKSQQVYSKAGEIAQEVVAQIRTVKAFVGEDKAMQSYSAALSSGRKLGQRNGLAMGLGIGFNYGLLFVSFAPLLWYAGYLIRSGQTSGGLAFTTVLNVVASSLALGQTAPELTTIGKAKVSGYTVLTMIERKPLISQNDNNGYTLENICGHIELRKVHFSYPSRPDIKIFNDFTLSIPAGKVVAIVGRSGSGKSTVISLIERFYDTTAGDILLDGHSIKTLKLTWLRNQMGLVNQEPALFATTIRENILYGISSDVVFVSDDDVVKAATIACAHDFIHLLPNRYDTDVGERGVQLSGGQKQRIAIARALLRNPKILLLDEATSALDSESEKYVQDALDKAMLGRTTVIVAHRLSTIRNADIIAVLQDGKVAEMGSHDELIQKDGAYAVLVKMQSQEANNPCTDINPAMISRAVDSLRINSFGSAVDGSISQRTFSFRSLNGLGESSSVRSYRNINTREEDEELEINTEGPAVSLTRLFRINAREWPYGILSVAAAVASGTQVPLFGLTISQALVYFNTADGDVMKRGLVKVTLMCCALSLLSLLANTCQYFFSAIAGENVTMRIRKLMFSSVLRSDISWFDQNNSSIIVTRLSFDASLVRATIVDGMVLFFQNMGLVLTGLIITFNIQWKVALIVLVSFPATVAANIGQIQFSKGFNGDLSKAYMQCSMVAGEAVSNIRTVAAFSAEEKILNLFSSQLNKQRKRSLSQAQIGGLSFGISQCIFFASYGLVMWYSGRLIRHGDATFAEAMKCIVVLMVTAFTIAEALGAAPDILKGTKNMKPMFQILDRKNEINGDDATSEYQIDDVEKIDGEIEFRHVYFRYPTRPTAPVLKNLNLKIKAGRSLALVGTTGSGKSSIISLITRFYDPVNGSVLIDGKDIKRYKLKALLRHIGLVQQEPVLFSTSIYENIKYGNKHATEAEIVEAARASNAHGFISELPDGYATEVGERGVRLSGGQKQRVAIARAVLRNPAILLLDEATSALDVQSESLVQAALDKLMEHRTTVLVAHRLYTIRNADTIAVLQSGSVVEQGSHAQLMTKLGAYYQLLNLGHASHRPSSSSSSSSSSEAHA